MGEHPPLTREERGRTIAAVRNKGPHDAYTWFDRDLLRYEATVEERERRIAALEAELDACRKSDAAWEDSAGYESKKRADAEAEIKRLTLLAEVAEAVEGMALGYALHREDTDSWLVRESNLSGWERHPFPPTVVEAMKKAAEEYDDPTWGTALRGAKGESDA